MNKCSIPHQNSKEAQVKALGLLDRPIAYHRHFVNVAGSVTAAVMLSQACYWSPRTKDNEGWFYKTVDEWELETGLTRYEQETARKKLKALGFWEERLKGNPAKTHYRLDTEKLWDAVLAAHEKYLEQIERYRARKEEKAENRAARLEAVGEPTRFQPSSRESSEQVGSTLNEDLESLRTCSGKSREQVGKEFQFVEMPPTCSGKSHELVRGNPANTTEITESNRESFNPKGLNDDITSTVVEGKGSGSPALEGAPPTPSLDRKKDEEEPTQQTGFMELYEALVQVCSIGPDDDEALRGALTVAHTLTGRIKPSEVERAANGWLNSRGTPGATVTPENIVSVVEAVEAKRARRVAREAATDCVPESTPYEEAAQSVPNLQPYREALIQTCGIGLDDENGLQLVEVVSDAIYSLSVSPTSIPKAGKWWCERTGTHPNQITPEIILRAIGERLEEVGRK